MNQFIDLKTYQSMIISLTQKIDLTKLVFLADVIISTSKNLGRIYTAGNGGSAALADHMATDLSFNAVLENININCISLTGNTSTITASGNDIGYENIFSRQIKKYCNKNDLIILISASGNSKNLVSAVETAKSLKIRTFSLTAFDGGSLKKITDYNLHIETPQGVYGIAEDLHNMVSHMIINEISQR
jgi:D-sedoheptulose 7-phosphate isomerase